jgi:hypothetical protein
VVIRVRFELLGALVAILVTSTVAPVRAAPGNAALVVTRDDGSRECPDSVALSERVEIVAGKPLFARSASEPRNTWVQVEFIRAITGYRAVISARGNREGTRTLDDVGPECGSLAEAVAVTLAILLDPAAHGASAPEPPMLPMVAAAPAPVHDGPPANVAQLASAEPRAGAFGVEASAGASFGILDGVVPFLEGGGRAHVGRALVLALGGGFVLPDRAPYAGGSIGLSLPYGYARACANVLPKKRTALEACLEAMLGGLRGEGHGYDENYVDWVFWSAAAALFQAYGRIEDGVLWSARARLVAPLARHGFSVSAGDATERAFEVSPLGGTLSVGLEVEL